MTRLAWLAFALTLLGCRTRDSVLPRTPEQAFQALAAAARADDPGAVFEQLDLKTRWSATSVYNDLRQICALIRTSYPPAVQARELGRCRLAASSAEVKVFVGEYLRQRGLLDPLRTPTPPTPRAVATVSSKSGAAERVELVAAGARFGFCREPDGSWTCCGLREHFEELKVKTARDLETVKENAESYSAGR